MSARRRQVTAAPVLACVALLSLILIAAIVPTTIQDFRLPGTQIGQFDPNMIERPNNCAMCHGDFDPEHEPYATWRGSLMGLAGRDPLFYAQMTTANQDAGDVGYFCLRCHVPVSFMTGHAYQSDGSTLDDRDMDGVSCQVCHVMVDPIYKPGISPLQDVAILADLAEVPQFYGNAMFVFDPSGRRRGPYDDAFTPHEFVRSPFHQTGEFCGTCHDVGSPVTTLLPDGTYRYNTLDQASPTTNLHHQFPLERTYTEWKLSQFAATGVDMGGRFGGDGATVVQTCQDCHMPKTTARGCFFGPVRDDIRVHEFAGAAAPILDLIAEHYADDPAVDLQAIAAGRAAAVSMLQRAATLELAQDCGAVRVRVINESGHKLPTGHIEGRRVWLNVRFYDEQDTLIGEFGHYDALEAELDEPSTRIYEMEVGLSAEAAALTGYPAGRTTHMSLADTIVKDSRIPPRGFNNASYAAAGAPVVEAHYADGQYWDDAYFSMPPDAARVEATLHYQNLPRHYIEALRDGNHTDSWGQILFDLWVETGKGAPIPMADGQLTLSTTWPGDVNCDCATNLTDLALLLRVFGSSWHDPVYEPRADFDGNHAIGLVDLALLLREFGTACP